MSNTLLNCYIILGLFQEQLENPQITAQACP